MQSTATAKLSSKQFAWAYLIKHGMGGRKHSYYGGYDICVDVLPLLTKKQAEDTRWGGEDHIGAIFKDQIRNKGIDWDKTYAPRNASESVFEGTFADSGTKEVITGTLYLKGGGKQEWVADALEVTNVFEMMAQADDVIEEFSELFRVGGDWL